MKPKILFIALITTIIFLFHFLSGCKKNENADEIVPLACKIIKPEQNEIITKGDTVLVLINFSGTEGPNNAKNLFIDVHSRQLSDNKPYHYSWNTFYEDTGIHNLYIEYYDPENVEGGAVDYCKVSIVKGNFPYADFDADNISGIAPLLVSFTDKSDNSPTFWHWEFGDGSTSTLQNPTHIYTETGSYIVSLTAGNLNGKSTREEFNYINVIEFNPCPGTPTISYQGQVYNTVQIGDQCWMRENLNWDTASSSCYNNSPTNCEVYGRLYNWHTIMNGAQASNSVPSGVQGICPAGWHFPSDAEWTTYTDNSESLNFEDLEIYQLAFEYAIKLHRASLKLPKFELYEQGSQIRRSSKSIKDQISEGYGRRRYKPDFIKFLVYASASCDELKGQLNMLKILYPDIEEFENLLEPYHKLSIKINNFIKYVENNWKT